MRQFGLVLTYCISQLSEVYASVFRDSIWSRLRASSRILFAPPAVWVSLFTVFFCSLVNRESSKWNVRTQWKWKASYHEFSGNSRVRDWQETSGHSSRGGTVHNSSCHKQSTMGSWFWCLFCVSSSLLPWKLGFLLCPNRISTKQRSYHCHFWGPNSNL